MEANLTETGGNAALSKQLIEWDAKPVETTITRPDGTTVSLIISPYVRIKENILHFSQTQGETNYDIPTDGDFNFILYSNDSNDLIPLAAASIAIEGGIPTVTMIQRVKARIIEEPPLMESDDLIKIKAMYRRTAHPKLDLLQGENKIEWQQLLLNSCEATTRAQGFDRLRLRSGFVSKYAFFGHNLPLAVQQYDYMVYQDNNWTPMDRDGQQINDPALGTVIKRVRNKKINTTEELGNQFPNFRIPAFWEKRL